MLTGPGFRRPQRDPRRAIADLFGAFHLPEHGKHRILRGLRGAQSDAQNGQRGPEIHARRSAELPAQFTHASVLSDFLMFYDHHSAIIQRMMLLLIKSAVDVESAGHYRNAVL